MRDDSGAGIVVGVLIILLLAVAISVGTCADREGEARGRAAKTCEIRIDTAHTAADSISVLRDTSCTRFVR